MTTRHLAGLWRPALALLALGVAPVLFPELQLHLRFERTAVLDGQWWRLATANLVHTNLPHALLNLAGLGLCCLLFPGLKNPRPWLLALLLCALASTAFLLLYPEITWYVGLSGALHGLFLFGAVQEWRLGIRSAGAIAALVLGKLLWEHWGGMEPGTAELIAARVVTEAHWWGGLAGLALGLIPPRRFNWAG
ncbi:MAG: rhombosortase [Gammaproteobacteria bacterium]|nr:rhombosortase [Gammaproteobacteria bacterium]